MRLNAGQLQTVHEDDGCHFKFTINVSVMMQDVSSLENVELRVKNA